MLHVSECMEDRTVSRFDPIHLFHTADFTDPLLAALGGDFNKVRTPVVTARLGDDVSKVRTPVIITASLTC